MDRAQTLQLLTEHLPVLMKRFNVTDLALFGSTANGILIRPSACITSRVTN
ncbi:MAG: hypothetical protein Q8O34_13965 [Rhodocyclaceae bacterium]|nr:hypothetical protein [Rhodocyclaceae bacterium]